MDRAQEYRDEAKNLRRLAQGEPNPRVKATILGLADQYETLANQREKYLELVEEMRTSGENRDN